VCNSPAQSLALGWGRFIIYIMSIRKVPLVQGEYFHLYNRGNGKREIFLDDEDYQRFTKLLYLCNSERNVNFREDIVKKHIDAWDWQRGEAILSIGAWVLMPNHFHIYVTSPKQGFGPEKTYNAITKFMSKLSTSYSKYFNKKYNRTGKLFEDKFKSVHVGEEVQAKYLYSYIHLNPVKLIQSDWKVSGIADKASALKFLNAYRWSSYHEYRKVKRKENLILNKRFFPDYFEDQQIFEKEIFEWLAQSKALG
jgi:putative transposase